jgi:hypothetical protein
MMGAVWDQNESWSSFLDRLDSEGKSKKNVDIIKSLEARGDFTEDFAKIRDYQYHLVFIYDFQMKRTGANNELLSQGHAKYLGDAYSSSFHYYLKETKDVGHTAAFDSVTPDVSMKAHLWGDVYACSPELMLDLDVYYENGLTYERTQRQFFLVDQELPFKSEKKITGLAQKCWVYLGCQQHWQNRDFRLRSRAHNPTVNKQLWMS